MAATQHNAALRIAITSWVSLHALRRREQTMLEPELLFFKPCRFTIKFAASPSKAQTFFAFTSKITS
jgi:hypothetical protein